MSLIKAIKAQLGLSVTSANNFTLDASADGGATPLKLTRNDGVDILTVDAAGKVAFPQNAQTWQDVTGSRVLNTDYTNSTGQVIDILVQTSNTAVASTFSSTILVGGISISENSIISDGGVGYDTFTHSVSIPHGSTYKLTGIQASIFKWMELR